MGSAGGIAHKAATRQNPSAPAPGHGPARLDLQGFIGLDVATDGVPVVPAMMLGYGEFACGYRRGFGEALATIERLRDEMVAMRKGKA